LLAHGWWFSRGTPASSTTKTGHHDIAEIFLKVALKHQKSKSTYDVLELLDFMQVYHEHNGTLFVLHVMDHLNIDWPKDLKNLVSPGISR